MKLFGRYNMNLFCSIFKKKNIVFAFNVVYVISNF
jgi:hypothetical protein